MTAIQVQIRDAIKDAINTAASGYVDTATTAVSVIRPREDIDGSIALAPKVQVITLGFDNDATRLTRAKSTERIIATQINLQRALHNQATEAAFQSACETLMELVEQILDTVEADFVVSTRRFSWTTTRPLRDENGLCFSYADLIKDNVFNSIFTVLHKTPIERTSCS